MVEVVNVVASGNIGTEVDLETLAESIDFGIPEFTLESGPILRFSFKDSTPVMTLYRSGSYVIMGADSKSQVESLHSRLSSSLLDLGIDTDGGKSGPEIQNLICKFDLPDQINLDSLHQVLGTRLVEYEPEQSPFLYYRPEIHDCLITCSSSGPVMVTGITSIKEARAAFAHFRAQLPEE